MTQITAVTAALAVDATLGCGIPSAEIWTKGGATRVMTLEHMTKATYDRVFGDTSQATVILDAVAVSADPSCCEDIRNVDPWSHELFIYRDGELAWLGPIVEMELDDDTLTIRARDLSVWLDHRFVHQQHTYGTQSPNSGDTDTTTIFTDLVTDAMAPDTSPNLALDFGLVSGVLASGDYTPGAFKYVGPTIRDLAKGSVDWYVLLRALSYTGPGATSIPAHDVTSASLANPGFEVNTTGWSTVSTATNNAVLSRVTTQHHGGVAALKTVGQAGKATIEYVFRTTFTNLTVGHSYRVEGYVRGPAAAYTSGWASWKHGYFQCANGQSADFAYSALHDLRTTWQKITLNFDATATSHNLDCFIQLHDSTATELYFDDFTIGDLTSVLIPNDPSTAVDFRLTDEDFLRPPKIVKSGLSQATRTIVTGQQTGGDAAFYGEAPSPPWDLNTNGPGLTAKQTQFGLLETRWTSTLADAASAESQARQRDTVLSDTPVIATGFILAKDAGVEFDNLIPGRRVAIQLDRPCLTLQQTMLLRQISVVATPKSEQVSLNLEPLSTGS